MYAFGCLLFWLLVRADAVRGRRPAGRRAPARPRGRARRSRPASRTRRARPRRARRRAARAPTRRIAPRRPRCSTLLGVGPAGDRRGRAARERGGRERATRGVRRRRSPTAVLEPPESARARGKRRRGRRMVAVAIGDRRRGGARVRRRHDRERRPRRRGAPRDRDDRATGAGGARRRQRTSTRPTLRSSSAGAPTPSRSRPGRVIAQTPAAGHAGRADRPRPRRPRQPRHRLRGRAGRRGTRRSRRRDRGAARRGLRRRACAAEESWEVPEGRVISSDVSARRRGTAARPDRARRLERAAARTGSRRPRARRRRGGRAARRQLRDRHRRGRLDAAAAGSVLRQSPAPGARAVLGSTVTLTIARAPEWRTTWSQSGSGSYDSDEFEVDGAAGRVADRRRAQPALPDLRLRLGERRLGGNRRRARSASTRSARTRSRRSAARARYRCTCARRAVSAGPSASSSSARQPTGPFARGATHAASPGGRGRPAPPPGIAVAL